MNFTVLKNEPKRTNSLRPILASILTVLLGTTCFYPATAFAGQKDGKKAGSSKCQEGGKKHGRQKCTHPPVPERISDYYIAILTTEKLIAIAPEDETVTNSPFEEIDEYSAIGGSFGSLYTQDNNAFWISEGNTIGTVDGFLYTGTNTLCPKGQNAPPQDFTASSDFAYLVGPYGLSQVSRFEVFSDCNGSAGTNNLVGNMAFADSIANGPNHIVIHGSDIMNSGIFKLNTGTNTFQHVGETFYGNTKSAFSKQGNLYVLNVNTNCLKLFKSSDIDNPPNGFYPQEYCLNLGANVSSGATNIATGINLADAVGSNGQTDLFLSVNQTGGGSKIIAFEINVDGSVNNSPTTLYETSRQIIDFSIVE